MPYFQKIANNNNSPKPVLFRITGALMAVVALGMMAPMMLSIADHNKDFDSYFVIIFGLIATSLFFIHRSRNYQHCQLNARHIFLLTLISWLVVCSCAVLPFIFCLPHLTLIDAWFESVSAITTTGSTVITGLDTLPRSILLWRAELQWFGGIGIVVMALAIFPFLRIGGMRLFQSESSDISNKFTPKVSELAGRISAVYLIMSSMFALCYWIGGMGWFDAITHAMTTAATGGFSNYDNSFGAFNNNPQLIWMCSLFMFIAGLPFVLFVGMMHGHWKPILHDPQVRWFSSLLLIVISVLTLYLIHHHQADTGLDSNFLILTHTTFNIISVVTTTGYASQDYLLWGGFASMIFFIITISGACAGSTSGGIKAFRQQLGANIVIRQLKQLMHPKAVFVQRYQGRPINNELLNSIISFNVLYFISIAIIAILLAFSGLDLITAITGSMTALSNVGPGFGDQIGPSGNFQQLPDSAKFWLSFGMLLGRLEVVSVVMLFMPSYWKA